MKLEEAHRMLDSIAARRAEEWALIKTLGLADRLPDPATSVNPTDAQQPRLIPYAAYTCFALPEGLHPNTATLVRDFAEAMAKKLRASEIKYGWKAGWMRKNWRDELAAELLRHVHKGDPIDVAAYCAFAWFHGWSVSTAKVPATSGGQAATTYDPLRRIDYPEGRFGPTMLDGDDEMTDKALKLIAKSHGFDLRLKVEEWEGEAGEIMERGGTFAEALEATCLLQVDKDGYRLVGAWDDEEGNAVLAYVRPLVADAKPEGSAPVEYPHPCAETMGSCAGCYGEGVCGLRPIPVDGGSQG